MRVRSWDGTQVSGDLDYAWFNDCPDCRGQGYDEDDSPCLGCGGEGVI